MAYCIRCYQDKSVPEMKSQKICLLCAEKRRRHYKNNSEKIKAKSKEYYNNNKEKMLEWQKQYYKENEEHIKVYNERYYQEHRNALIVNAAQNAKERKKRDPIFKLRKRVSSDIWGMLKLNKGSKNGSVLKFLPYTVQALKEHLESQFEPWMTWDNWGSFNKRKWNDNDPTTWTWNIDHIIPHHTFKYSSMSDQSFRDCWSLDNLRPLSSKINLQKNGRLK